MTVRYAESDPSLPETLYESHIHTTCKILIHISGDIIFNVENNLYPVLPGNVIITRPFEYHHCIYRSNAAHKHFCIFLQVDDNEYLYDLFFKRNAGERNLLILSQEDSEKMISICHEIVNVPETPLREYFRFFKLLQYLSRAEVPETVQHSQTDVIHALTFINEHISERITVASVAKFANVSVNTLERHFKNMFNITPAEYLRQKRLARAMELLAQSYNVSETCELCGFTDTSAFINQFRRSIGMTPLQYKKSLEEKTNQTLIIRMTE